MKKIISMILSSVMLISLTPWTISAEGTETKTVAINVEGAYNDINYWDEATYTYDVVDGTPAEYGWISNGDYKFMYYPSTGQIKNADQASSFAYETGGSSDTIVIPTHIGAFSDGGTEYAEKDVVMFAQNTNYAIFRYNNAVNGKTIVIPEGVTSIPYNVFGQMDSSSYTRFVLPSTLTRIEQNAFAQSSGGGVYYDFELPESLTYIGPSAFQNCRFTSMTVPAGVTSIEVSTFQFTRTLKDITFEGEITSIGGYAFRESKALEAMTFKGKHAPTAMGENMFMSASTSITVYYPANGQGYTDEAFTSAFPDGTVFEKLPGNPAAEKLAVTGGNVVGSTLYGTYVYDDPMGNEESGSTATWQRADDAGFTKNVETVKTEPVSAETGSSYTLTEADADKYIRFSVIPRNAAEELNEGDEASVVYSQKIRMPQTVPTVTLTSPYNGLKAYENTALTISADAACDNTTISKIEFYINDALYGTTYEAPYMVTWTPDEAGKYSIYAKAYNALGETGESGTVTVEIYSLDESIEPVWAAKWSYDFNEFKSTEEYNSSTGITLPGTQPAAVGFYGGIITSEHGLFGREESDYHLKLTSTASSSESARIYFNLDNLDKPVDNLVAEMDAAFSSTNETRHLASYRTTNLYNGLVFSANGNIAYYSDEGYKVFYDSSGAEVKYEADRWYHIAAKFDFVNQTITYYLDGEKLGEIVPPNPTAMTYVSEVSIKGIVNKNDPGTMYLDNFVLSQEQDSYITSVLTSPESRTYLTGSDITFSGYAKDSRGNEIEKTEFYIDGSMTFETTDASYEFIKNNITPGRHELRVKSISSDGLVGYSNTVEFVVADYSMPAMYSDGMVLQRNKPIKISGKGNNGAKITASVNGSAASGVVENGRFEITLPSQAASKETELTIESGGVKTAYNAAIGEIILCNGQSNMAYSLSQFSSLQGLSDKDYNDIHLFKQDSGYTTSPQTDIPSGRWVNATRQEAVGFSAFGFGTGQILYHALNEEVPIGLIYAAIGGTNINTWVPNGLFGTDPDTAGITAANNNTAYNLMVAPWTSYTIGHVLWYQGEANTVMSWNYEKSLTKYIDGLREDWDDEDITFTIIQLPIYNYPEKYNSAFRTAVEVRAAEWNVSERLDNVATVVAIDTGSASGIHPNDKLPLVQRAANAILHFIDPDNADLIYKSPSMDTYSQDGDVMTITFKDIAEGLKTTDGESPRGFKIAGDDNVFADAAATLDGNTIKIDTSSVTGTPKVRYAWEDCPALSGDSTTLNLVNSAGLPMAPFRTDTERYLFAAYENGVYSNPLNFTPMIRKITSDSSGVITVNARDYDDEIVTVEVFADGTSIGMAEKISDDEYQIKWDSAALGTHEVYAIATDTLGTTSTKQHESLGTRTVSPVKYTIVISNGESTPTVPPTEEPTQPPTAPPTEEPTTTPPVEEDIIAFTDLEGNAIESFDETDGVRVISTESGQMLIIAAYKDGILIGCEISYSDSAELTSEDLTEADTVRAYLFDVEIELKPLADAITIRRFSETEF